MSSVVLNNEINFAKFDNALSKVDTKKILNIPTNAFVIGHIGRFMYQKNHTFLVQILNELSKINPNAFLLMVGDREKVQKKNLTCRFSIKIETGKIRTSDPQIRNLMLYPAELRSHLCYVVI